MAEEAISLETKLRMVLLGFEDGVSISELCEQVGVSRQTFYKWRRRYEREGIEGLRERSRRPQRSPGQVSVAVEDEIVRLRKELTGGGLDAGARSIRSHFGSQPGVPSVASIHRVLVRRGLVTPQPNKRPRCSWRRFEWLRPNDLWQIDAISWQLSGGSEVEIIDILDDHSRYITAIAPTQTATMEAAWATLAEAMISHGPPARLLSDGGLAFTGRRHGTRVDFEDWTEAVGTHQIVSSPYHPQTLGKLERFHQTLKRWLAAQDDAENLDQLADQLEKFQDYYNYERPHQGIGGNTPASRFHGTRRAEPGSAIEERQPQTKAGYRKVSSNGVVSWGPYDIGVGMTHGGDTVCVIQTEDTIEIFTNNHLVRRLAADPTHRYQPTGNPPGRPPTKL